MPRYLKQFPGILLRGYGQLFLCNNVISGTLFFVALCLMSPFNAMLSLISASIVTLGAQRFCGKTALIHTGLFGVNGVLFGYFWVLFPEISPIIALIATVTGSIVLIAILVPATACLQQPTSPFTIFSLPAVLTLWLCLGALGITGQYDLDIYKGWKTFFRQSYGSAEILFQNTHQTPPRLGAYRSDGLGWIAFRRGNYIESAAHFQLAISLDASVSDPWDGAGWSSFKLNQYPQAIEQFRQSLDRNPQKGSSWDGLGWCHYLQGDLKEAETAFQKAVMCAPLFDDPYLGLALCQEATGLSAPCLRRIHQDLGKLKGSSLAFLSPFHILGWLLFLAGIAVHSRISVMAVLLALGLTILLPGSTDVNMYFNLVALIIALAGAYLVMSPTVAVALVSICVFVTGTWHLWEIIPLPTVSLPFNVYLLLILLVSHRFKGKLGVETVPLEMAVTKPETVIWWKRKKVVVERALKILRHQ